MQQWLSFGTSAGVSIGETPHFTTVLCYGFLGNGCLLTACLIRCRSQVCHNWGLALCSHTGLWPSETPWGPQRKNFRPCFEDTLTFWFLLISALLHRLDCLSLALPLANSSSPKPTCHLFRDFPVSPKWYCFPLLLILIAPWTLPLLDLRQP